MFFTIEASRFFYGINESYTFNRNNEWSKHYGSTSCDSNFSMIFDTFSEAEEWFKNNTEVTIQDVKYSTESKNQGDNGSMNFSIVMHRENTPKHMFTKKELYHILLTADGSKDNTLIVDSDGYLRLIELKDYYGIRLDWIPVRYETFLAENNQLGNGQNVLRYLDNIYISCLQGWLTHLQTGKSIYVKSQIDTKQQNELMEEIKKIYNSFRVSEYV